MLEDPKDAASILYFSKQRAESVVKTGVLDLWKDRWARIPLTKHEKGKLIKLRHEEDELQAIKVLGNECSVSDEFFQRLGLTRCVIERTLAELTHSRKERTGLCNVICATRFEYAQDGKLYPTVCRRRGRQETFQHMVKCANLKVPVPTEDPDPTIAFLKDLAKSACRQGTARPLALVENGNRQVGTARPSCRTARNRTAIGNRLS